MIAIGDTVVVIAKFVTDEDGKTTAMEGTRGIVVGFQGDAPVVSFDATDTWMTFPVEPDSVQAIRRPPPKGRRR